MPAAIINLLICMVPWFYYHVQAKDENISSILQLLYLLALEAEFKYAGKATFFF